MQLSQRSLTGSDADRALFVNRTVELGHLERSAQLGFSVLVLGERGMGSTSLVRQHQRRLEDSGHVCYYVNAGRSEGMADLVRDIRLTVAGPRQRDLVAEVAVAARAFVQEVVPDRLRELRALSAAGSELEGRRPVIILDEMNRPELVHELFERYRDEIWQMPL